MSEKYCVWTADEHDDYSIWETDCGNTFQLEYDGPEENKMKFCCYCGKLLKQEAE